jgi:hypothetical protein
VQTQAFTLLDRNYIRKVRIPGSKEAGHPCISTRESIALREEESRV